MRRVFALLVTIGAIACGGDASTAGYRYPDVAGTYQLAGTFDGFPTSGPMSGTVTLTQPSRNDTALGGNASIFVDFGAYPTTTTGIYAASIGDGGVVTFYVGSPGAATWKFTGTANGSTITGTHQLIDANRSFSGPFTATR